MPDYSDGELVNKAIAGDMQAFRHLVERHQLFVYRVAYRLVGTVADAEDIAQESLVRLWRNLERYRPEIRLTTWLYAIVTNLCLDFLKSKQNRNTKRNADLANYPGIQGHGYADDGILHEELSIAIQQITEHLSPKQKIVFVLRDVEGVSMEEIATVLSTSAGKVKSNLYYARKAVARMLEQYYRTKQPAKT